MLENEENLRSQREEPAKATFLEFDENARKYLEGDRLTYNEEVYVVLQDHISSEAALPDRSPELYRRTHESVFIDNQTRTAGTLLSRVRNSKIRR